MKSVRGAFVAAAVALLLCGGVACSKSGGGKDEGPTIQLSGSGASFPAPLYSKWFKAYNKLHPNVQVDYQSIGSGGGKTNVIQKKVDFGASDAAMSPDEMAKVDVGVQLLPMTAGTIVLAYNLEGVDDLKLSREAYVGIFLGKIKKWNAPEIAKTNPDAKLPDSDINVVVRADGSGTSYVFSQHFSAISEEFKKSPGTNTQPNWPVGTKAAKNDGVAAAITKSPRLDRLPGVWFCQVEQDQDGRAGEQGGQVRRADDCLGPGGVGRREAAGRPDRLGSRSRGRRIVSDRHLHVDHLLQEV